MEKKLSVKNLVISFRTPGGKVQAVRNISFDLNKGETLAIVGESGSGKSVTSKAILGILAGNSIVEGGSIIYDGMDLLKVSEDDFYRIRGDKIAMIFQDPLSSLNPIMRIGKQLTEAMLLKGKARQKSSKEAFNTTMAQLEKAMIASLEDTKDGKTAADMTALCKNFDKFEFKHIELESAYNEAYEAALEAVDLIKDILFRIEKNAFDKDERESINEVIRLSKDTKNTYVVYKDAAELDKLLAELKKTSASEIKVKKERTFANTAKVLTSIQKILENALQKKEPDFFSMGCYVAFSGKEVPVDMPVEELNKMMRQYADETLINEFRKYAKAGLAHNVKKYNALKEEALKVLRANRDVFAAEKLDKKACYMAASAMTKAVEASIDRLEIHKDGVAYVFGVSIKADLDNYFEGIGKNKIAAKKHEKQQKKYDSLVKKGKTPSWKVTPSTAVDLDVAKQTTIDLVDRMIAHYEEVVAAGVNKDFDKETDELIIFFKENASGVVNKVTKSMAKYKALKLMEEVGITDVRRRYRQYPFEFSGGMRQRIVIAIALAANPDILICDEPTTALDVTIQAQILELINKLKADRNLSIIFITHDLGVVANMADRIAVMYAGKIVEYGTCEEVFYEPAHPYTWALLSAMPDVETNERLESIPGTPPNMIYPPVGDAFADRNKYALKIDFEMQPPMIPITETHSAATWLLHPDAPKVEPPKIITERIARMKAKGGNYNA